MPFRFIVSLFQASPMKAENIVPFPAKNDAERERVLREVYSDLSDRGNQFWKAYADATSYAWRLSHEKKMNQFYRLAFAVEDVAKGAKDTVDWSTTVVCVPEWDDLEEKSALLQGAPYKSMIENERAAHDALMKELAGYLADLKRVGVPVVTDFRSSI